MTSQPTWHGLDDAHALAKQGRTFAHVAYALIGCASVLFAIAMILQFAHPPARLRILIPDTLLSAFPSKSLSVSLFEKLVVHLPVMVWVVLLLGVFYLLYYLYFSLRCPTYKPKHYTLFICPVLAAILLSLSASQVRKFARDISREDFIKAVHERSETAVADLLHSKGLDFLPGAAFVRTQMAVYDGHAVAESELAAALNDGQLSMAITSDAFDLAVVDLLGAAEANPKKPLDKVGQFALSNRWRTFLQGLMWALVVGGWMTGFLLLSASRDIRRHLASILSPVSYS